MPHCILLLSKEVDDTKNGIQVCTGLNRYDWNPGTWVLICEYSARAIQWIPTWQGLGDFKILCVLWMKVTSALEGLRFLAWSMMCFSTTYLCLYSSVCTIILIWAALFKGLLQCLSLWSASVPNHWILPVLLVRDEEQFLIGEVFSFLFLEQRKCVFRLWKIPKRIFNLFTHSLTSSKM